MGCLVPDDGYKTVSIDLSAGEPTVTAHYSQDKRYRYATFDGVGKAPYYDRGVLMIDDIYLMTMSVSPIGSELMSRTFNSHKFNGKTFEEQWLIDSEVVKGHLKKERQLHKMLCLAEGTLVRVRGEGWVPIEKIKPGSRVWDGVGWVTTDGPVFNGLADTIERYGVTATPDHQILTSRGWEALGEASDACKAGTCDAAWSDVWTMARRFIGNPETWKSPLYLGRLWVRRTVENIRQLKGGKEYRMSDVSTQQLPHPAPRLQ